MGTQPHADTAGTQVAGLTREEIITQAQPQREIQRTPSGLTAFRGLRGGVRAMAILVPWTPEARHDLHRRLPEVAVEEVFSHGDV